MLTTFTATEKRNGYIWSSTLPSPHGSLGKITDAGMFVSNGTPYIVTVAMLEDCKYILLFVLVSKLFKF